MAERLALRFGGILTALFLLGLFGWITLDLQQSRERELLAAEKQGATLARLLEGHFHGSLRQIDQHLADFALRYQYAVAAGAPRAQVEAQLQHYLKDFPELHSFRVAGIDGNYLYDASGVLATAVNIADRPYFARLRDDPGVDLSISEPLLSRVTGDMVIVVARRLQDPSGGFAGIVLATLRADYYERYYADLDVGQHGVIALWSTEMELFARRPALAEGVSRKLRNSPIPAALAAGQRAGSFRRSGALDGEARVFSFRAVEGAPFVFSIGLAERDILAEWRHRVIVYALLGAVLILAVIALVRAWRRGYDEAEALAEKMTRAYAEKSREGRALLDAIPDPAWLLDNDGRFVSVNEAFCRGMGKPMADIIGRTVDELFPPAEARRLREGQLAVYRKGSPERQLVWLVTGGVRRPYEFLRVPVFGDGDEPKGLAGVAWDMTERYEAEERQRLITHFFDHASDAVLILDAQRRVLTLNRSATAISGFQLDELRHKPADFVFSGCDTTLREHITAALGEHGIWRGELAACRKDGSPLPIHCTVSAIHDDDGAVTHWAMFITDLSERKAAEARIESLTHVDQLTDLPNRQGFTRILDDWLTSGREGALIVIDLDQLSRINDAFGHSAGDIMLRRAAIRLRRLLRDDDALGRLGGDQFGVLIAQGRDPQKAETITARLLERLARPVQIELNDVVTTASAGICQLGSDGGDSATLLRNADAALHQAKKSGQSKLRFFSADMNVRMAERLRLESDLRLALGRGELMLHYQPQVDIRSGEIIGFESLLRWQHPELGMVSPVRFIPVAEESRLILPIGAWVLEEACRQNKAWQDAGMAPRVVAVNLSAVQFHSADILATVTRALEVSGLEAHYLELEITESVIVEDPERVVKLMDDLKTIGVKLSIDDFGTGYSSLSYLKRFPLDKIKIDRSFVRDLETSNSDSAIVRMVIGIAAELQHRVIAEGVETLEQLNFLQRHECDEYQGYYCSPAVPASEVPQLLARQQTR